MGSLDDRDLAAEIALLGEVLAAIAAVGHELTDPEVDALLGVGLPRSEEPPELSAG